MGKWAQSRHRGGGGYQNLCPSIVVTMVAGVGITWAIVGEEPPNWAIETSLDGSEGSYSPYVNVAGATRSQGGLTDTQFYRVVPADADANEYCNPSNAVQYFD